MLIGNIGCCIRRNRDFVLGMVLVLEESPILVMAAFPKTETASLYVPAQTTTVVWAHV
jgi:hypothetical protein